MNTHFESIRVFEWDVEDYQLLLEAKKGEMVSAGISSPSEAAVKNAVTKAGMARHCKRQTRGEEKTTELIEEMLLSFSSATDALGVPLLKEEMFNVWREQKKKHIKCIQDPPDIYFTIRFTLATRYWYQAASSKYQSQVPPIKPEPCHTHRSTSKK